MPPRVVTSQVVLVELLNSFADRGEHLRAAAADFASAIHRHPNVTVVPLSHELFDAALALYRQRDDKEWGLTDCTSFSIMSGRGIAAALSHDRHFVQAGFVALLRTA